MKDFIIIVQGATTYLKEVKEALKYNKVLYSTWQGEEFKYNSDDIVIFNEIPSYSGPANLNFQKTSTLLGLIKAKELGYKKALKLRSDIIPTNIDKFIDLIDNQCLNFLCWHHHEVYPNCPGYLVDYLMSGRIDDLIKLWDIKNMNWCNVPEIHLTNQYIQNLMDTVKINYFLSSLGEDNDLYWIKNKIMLSSYKENGVYNSYRKYDFSENCEHLKKNYTNFLNT